MSRNLLGGARVCARPGCGASLAEMRTDAVWCSDACRVATHRARKAEQSRNGKRYVCPNCAATLRTAKALVRHLLEEAGETGVTTNGFLRAGCGSRFGARIHELRHDEGLRIDERYLRPGASLYRLISDGALREAA